MTLPDGDVASLIRSAALIALLLFHQEIQALAIRAWKALCRRRNKPAAVKNSQNENVPLTIETARSKRRTVAFAMGAPVMSSLSVDESSTLEGTDEQRVEELMLPSPVKEAIERDGSMRVMVDRGEYKERHPLLRDLFQSMSSLEEEVDEDVEEELSVSNLVNDDRVKNEKTVEAEDIRLKTVAWGAKSDSCMAYRGSRSYDSATADETTDDDLRFEDLHNSFSTTSSSSSAVATTNVGDCRVPTCAANVSKQLRRKMLMRMPQRNASNESSLPHPTLDLRTAKETLTRCTCLGSDHSASIPHQQKHSAANMCGSTNNCESCSSSMKPGSNHDRSRPSSTKSRKFRSKSMGGVNLVSQSMRTSSHSKSSSSAARPPSKKKLSDSDRDILERLNNSETNLNYGFIV